MSGPETLTVQSPLAGTLLELGQVPDPVFAERMMGELDEVRVADKVASISFPEPAPCGKTPLFGKGLTKMYGSLEVFAGVDLAIGARLDLPRDRLDDRVHADVEADADDRAAVSLGSRGTAREQRWRDLWRR